MDPQMQITVRWMPEAKKWLITLEAYTTDGQLFRTATVTEEYGSPMTPETALVALEYVGLALRQAYPF